MRVSEGEHLGLTDIAFRILDEQQKIIEEREKQRMISPRDFTENERNEEFDFQVLARKVYCKFTIQTKSTCYLMQIEK